MNNDLKICVIGAGNVATHLALALGRVGEVVQILARTPQSASRLATLVGRGCQPIADPSALRTDADLYLIAVSDDSVARVVASTPAAPGIWAHTSGSVPMSVFEGHKRSYGVFYPLQTFSREAEVDIREVPFFIEGNTPEVTATLLGIARQLSDMVEEADSNRRRALHIAGVFGCNFANLMWMKAQQHLESEGLDIKYLMPLLKVTLKKLEQLSPREAMTGPARRGDTGVMNRHAELLSDGDREIYRLLSQEIMREFNVNGNEQD